MDDYAKTKRASLRKQGSFAMANKMTSLTRYIEGIKKKHEEDENYAKWDLTKPLPKLPLPELDSTLEKYLRCVKPIISEEAYANTERIIQEFAKPGGDGQKLQAIIQQAAEEKDNWVINCFLVI